MNRRDFVRLLSLSSAMWLGGCSTMKQYGFCLSCIDPFAQDPNKNNPSENHIGVEDLGQTTATSTQISDEAILKKLMKDDRAKSIYFSQNFPDDIFFTGEKLKMVEILTRKFRIVQRHVGFGNFNLLGMDDFIRFAAQAPRCGGISSFEKAFLEELFYFDGAKYGFKGEKVALNFTDTIKQKEVYKVPYSGHYLRKENSLPIYEKVKGDVGENLILTSGVRSLAKQFHLFFEKSLVSGGNMSMASRSIAPPGYSFHYKGDFDVGRKGFGLKNFDETFAQTDEFKRLLDLGYINIRYTQSNSLGVRFEPWHLKV